MIGDAKCEVRCDGNGCNESVEYTIPYRYASHSGSSGRYDFRERECIEWLEEQGWTVEDDDTFCESCSKS